MKPIKMTSEELMALRQIKAYEKLMKIADDDEIKNFAQQQYSAWCHEFIYM